MEEIENEGENKDIEAQKNQNSVLFCNKSNQILEPNRMVGIMG